MKIDLHVHSSERSACGQAGEEEQIEAAMAAGLNALVFTDHGKLVPESRLRELNEKYAPFRVFSGIEISLGEDILVFGIHDRELELAQWTYPELHAYVREQEGYMILHTLTAIILHCMQILINSLPTGSRFILTIPRFPGSPTFTNCPKN